jgi:hypothetical protein
MRCPGSGPSVRSSGSRCGTIAPVLPRISAGEPEPTAGGEIGRRLRSLLAASQWIAETSAVVRPMLRGPSPHSLPVEALSCLGPARGPFVEGREIVESRRREGGPSGERGLGPDHSDEDVEATRRPIAGRGTGGDSVGDRASVPGAAREPTERPSEHPAELQIEPESGGPLTHSHVGMNLLSWAPGPGDEVGIVLVEVSVVDQDHDAVKGGARRVCPSSRRGD